jgi:hypothetical protein
MSGIHMEPDWQIIIGLAVAVVLSLGVGTLVRLVGNSLPLPSPSKDRAEQWKRLADQQTGGKWIGRFEVTMFFAACWFQAWLLITGWLVFKLGFYWQSTNFAAFPAEPPDADQMDYMIAKRYLGTHHVATALIGTAANIVAALIGYAIAKSITLY